MNKQLSADSNILLYMDKWLHIDSNIYLQVTKHATLTRLLPWQLHVVQTHKDQKFLKPMSKHFVKVMQNAKQSLYHKDTSIVITVHLKHQHITRTRKTVCVRIQKHDLHPRWPDASLLMLSLE